MAAQVAPGWPVYTAARHGDMVALEAALRAGGNPEESMNGVPAVHMAARHGHVAAVSMLLAAGANPASVTDDEVRKLAHNWCSYRTLQ